MWNNEMKIKEIVGETILDGQCLYSIFGGMWNVT